MLRQCADDAALLVRSVGVLHELEPVPLDAGRFAGVRVEPEKCKVVLIGRERGQRERDKPSACVVSERASFRSSTARCTRSRRWRRWCAQLRWMSVGLEFPAAVVLRATVNQEVDVDRAHPAASRIPESVWGRSKRARRE